MAATPYINMSGRKVLEYNPPDSFLLDLPIILTRFRMLTRNMPYMLLEGSLPTAVRLIDVRHADGMVCLDIKELESKKTFTLSWDMDYDGDYWLWTLADYETLTNLPK